MEILSLVVLWFAFFVMALGLAVTAVQIFGGK